MGLDHPSDSRGIALSDWDLDGDLDLWISNRTAPRLRFLRNDLAAPARRFVQVLLQGVRCNRDAIGARVRVQLQGEPAEGSVRTLRAGEGYLSQSSKWMHFGFSSDGPIEKVEVHWPDGAKENFRGVALNGWFRLVQGTGQAERWMPSPPAVPWASTDPEVPPASSAAAIIPHARLPMPPLNYKDLSGQTRPFTPRAGRATLLVAWATWCESCLKELAQFDRSATLLSQAGIDLLPLSIDQLDDPADARLAELRKFYKRRGWSLGGGLASEALIAQLDVVQRVLTGRQRPMPVPCSFLIDDQGRLAAVYKGPLSTETLVAQVRNLEKYRENHRDLAVPLAGRWFVNPLSADLLAVPEKLLEIDRAAEAFAYLQRHIGTRDSGQGADPYRAAHVYARAGRMLTGKESVGVAIEALRVSLNFDPASVETRAALALVYESAGQWAQAMAEYRALLKRHPDHPAAANSLAWLLATSPAGAVRNPEEAVLLAERLCHQTQFKTAETMDTLAAAYAAAGRFEEAATMARRALAVAGQAGESATAQQIERRLRLYEQKQPFVLSSESIR